MTESQSKRLPHADFNLEFRYKKATKIERLLQLSCLPSPIKLLEIGTGSGGIAHYFAHHRGLNCEVTAVDVVDQRVEKNGYRFVLVQDTRLPFQASSFDVVLSNHVIEHVGDTKAQTFHLKEIHRVLKSSGVGYLAVPNRWMLIEPHFKLPFLSWLPVAWRTPYLSLMRHGTHYDCTPLTAGDAEALMRHVGFEFTNLSTQAIWQTIEIEGSQSLATKITTYLPNSLLEQMYWLNPTLIYKLCQSKTPA